MLLTITGWAWCGNILPDLVEEWLMTGTGAAVVEVPTALAVAMVAAVAAVAAVAVASWEDRDMFLEGVAGGVRQRVVGVRLRKEQVVVGAIAAMEEAEAKARLRRGGRGWQRLHR